MRHRSEVESCKRALTSLKVTTMDDIHRFLVLLLLHVWDTVSCLHYALLEMWPQTGN